MNNVLALLLNRYAFIILLALAILLCCCNWTVLPFVPTVEEMTYQEALKSLIMGTRTPIE